MNDCPLDRIFIRDLLVRCVIGVFEEERREKQDVIINVILYADLSQACQSDRIADTVDYKTVKKKIIALVEKSAFALVERLAEDIARLCLAEPGVKKATVTVDKPTALRYARSVAVEITRENKSHD